MKSLEDIQQDINDIDNYYTLVPNSIFKEIDDFLADMTERVHREHATYESFNYVNTLKDVIAFFDELDGSIMCKPPAVFRTYLDQLDKEDKIAQLKFNIKEATEMLKEIN